MFKKTALLLFVFVGIVFAFSHSAERHSNILRVAIHKEADHCILAINGRYTLTDISSGKKLSLGNRLRPTLIALEKGQLKIGETLYPAKKIMVEPHKEAPLRINDKHFRGKILLINNEGSSLTVVNMIELEQYIRGVLYHEISDKWPLEAIKTQAVATRTYALYSTEQYAARDYDMTSDVYSQVYGGKSAERYRTNLAVKATRGEVLTYKDKIFPTFFHANSGGVTESAAELWQIDIPPLKGGVVSPFSIESPHYRWKRNFRLKDIQDKLNALGYDLDLIKDIAVLERNASGRVRKLKVTTRNGKSEIIEGKIFREAMGPNSLKSNMYDIIMQGWFVDFVGHGWGHGVGLDQWGAYNMAKERYPYKQILQFYYPGSTLTRYQDID